MTTSTHLVKPFKNPYIDLALKDYSNWIFTEEQAKSQKGIWRDIFTNTPPNPIDLEIGVGNGYFFSHQSKTFAQRNLVGLELKYKPLIQTAKRTLKNNLRNFKFLFTH